MRDLFDWVDRSVQTDARAKPARPDGGAASGALAPCEATSRLGRAHDDGIRGSRPLPRAVRESLSPGRPGEIPGLAARPGVDACESRPSHGRLPARVLGVVEDSVRVGGALRAFLAR